MLLASGNAKQPSAITEVLVAEACFLGTEEKRDGAQLELFSHDPGPVLESSKRVFEFTIACNGCTYDKAAISHGIAYSVILFSLREDG
jgi:hypothetical protein